MKSLFLKISLILIVIFGLSYRPAVGLAFPETNEWYQSHVKDICEPSEQVDPLKPTLCQTAKQTCLNSFIELLKENGCQPLQNSNFLVCPQNIFDQCLDLFENDSAAWEDYIDEACEGAPEWPTTPYCGDGIINGNETCDDGNKISGDGCDSNCQREFHFEFINPDIFRVDEVDSNSAPSTKTPDLSIQTEDPEEIYASGSGCSIQSLGSDTFSISTFIGYLLLGLFPLVGIRRRKK